MRCHSWAGVTSAYLLFWMVQVATPTDAADPLSYLNHPCDPYYVGRDFPRLTTPQWVGEPQVDAVVMLSIDDMRDTQKYETFLRPLLDRLKQIDGRAPLSIFTNTIDPEDPQLQRWIDEGLSIEVHTIDHPCPLLQGGDFAQAARTYHDCVDLLHQIPGSQPVAFRMPCCDSQNTPSPRFWTEIFTDKTEQGTYLLADSSVFNVFTSNDKELPADIVLNEEGGERFRRYLPFPSFVNTIEDYPYPYVIAGQCWEFPCTVPSDWEAQHVQQPNNPQTVTAWKRALDATVIKQGVMPLVFHPHGWIRNDQLVELVDYADRQYGGRVKFLAFDEALARINQHLLNGRSIRGPQGRTGAQLLDVNQDGLLDVVLAGSVEPQAALDKPSVETRLWDPGSRSWRTFAQRLVTGPLQFGRLDGRTVLVGVDATGLRTFRISNDHDRWVELDASISAEDLPDEWKTRIRHPAAWDDYRLQDTNGDATSELFLTHQGDTIVLRSEAPGQWGINPYQLPAGTRLLTEQGTDAGMRFIDVNGDSHDDVLFSDGQRFSLHLFQDATSGWSRQMRAGRNGDPLSILPVVRSDGSNNGLWFHSGHLWVQNEDTDRLPDLVDRLAVEKLLADPATEPSTADQSEVFPAAKSPEESLAAFAERPGMTVEIVACEPDVIDPVALDWGPDGSLWVAEMRDYPNGISWYEQGDPLGEPGGCVRRLVDTDRDGRHDESYVFLDKVPFVSGVKAWRDGVIVTAAPEIFYAEDTDGDGRADRREVLFDGFSEGNQQHRVNGLRWGIDQWLYLANGHSGGTIKSLKTGHEVSIRGRDARIRPDQGHIETQSGVTQAGRVCDDYGNWFGGDNSNPVWHYALDEQYLARNPHFAPPSVRHPISVNPGAAPVYPTSRTLARFNDFDRANRYTSACSPEIFRDDFAIATDQRRFAYVCEPVHNLVAREVLEDNGTTFISHRAAGEQQQEFLTASDNWCRPVMVRTGPDGALWVADMYRLVIEHPEWIPRRWQDQLNLRGGEDRGRIYRIRFDSIPENHAGVTPWYQLDQLPTEQLAAALDSSNGTLREMVQQLLYWRDDRAAIGRLRQVVSQAEWPPARLNALYLLASWDAVGDNLLCQLIRFSDGSLARHAIRLAEKRLSKSPRLRDAMLEQTRLRAVSSADRRARQQLAYSLGEMDDARVGKALARLALDYRDDPYLVAAVMSSVDETNVTQVLAELTRHAAPAPLIAQVIRFAVAMDRPRAVGAALQSITASKEALEDQLQVVGAAIAAIKQNSEAGDTFLDATGAAAVAKIARAARATIVDPAADEISQIAAIGLLGHDQRQAEADLKRLLDLLTPLSSPRLQAAALQRLGELGGSNASQAILDRWSSFTPQLRERVLTLLTSRASWTRELLEAVASGSVLPAQIDARHRQQLVNHANSQLSELARQLLVTELPNPDRQAAVEQYRGVRELKPDTEHGKQVFQQRCATCHRFDGQGQAVGPDLMGLSDRSHDALLVAILDPNRAVEDKYLDYAVATTSGQQFSGLLTAETASAITLVLADGKQQSVLRREIEEIKALGKSLMPEGLEQDISPQDMADLIAHIQSVKARPKAFPGNAPQIAPVRDDGSIRLFAMHARIYGSTLVLEDRYRNLGFWGSLDDRAEWTLEVPKAGKYRVSLDYACADDTAGNRFLITAGSADDPSQVTLRGEITGTGGWDHYRWLGAGEIDLPEGQVQVTLRADGILNGYLGDVRTIILHPR